jgi:type VI secretion system protein ImpM
MLGFEKLTASAQLMYFGKVPSRGDFVRSNAPVQIVTLLDQWVQQGFEFFSMDPEWRAKFDQAAPIDFVFARLSGKRILTGVLAPSRDSNERRYPFIVCASLENVALGKFIWRTPFVLNRFFRMASALARDAAQGAEPEQALLKIDEAKLNFNLDPEPYEAGYRDFLELCTLKLIDARLGSAANGGLTREAIMGLGQLLAPLKQSTGSTLYRGVCLPLVDDPVYMPLVASLWLDMLSAFAGNGDYNLALFFCTRRGERQLVASLAGPTARIFEGLFDGVGAKEHVIDLARAQWAGDAGNSPYPVRKLASFLTHPDLSLKQASDTFREAFSGK